MKEKITNSMLCSLIIALGIFLGANEIKDGIINFKEYDSHVSVKGLAEKEVKANKVTWPLKYKEIGNDPTQMYSNLERKNAIIVAFLKAGGIKDDEISVNPPSITDRQADMYGNEPVSFRYRAESVITVTSTDIDKVLTLMRKQTELMKQDIPLIAADYGDDKVNYEFTGLNDIKPQMVEEATKNARATAEKFAADSGSKLGKIISASQGQVSITDRDATTPYIKNVRVVISLDYQLTD